jgi:uncharacterized membrane protein
MENELILFSAEQGNLLIRLLLAQIISNFVLQINEIAQNKKWISGLTLQYIAIVFTITFLLSGLCKISLAIAFLYWIINTITVNIQSKINQNPNTISIAKQLLYFIVITILWFLHLNSLDKIFKTISLPFTNYKFSLILLAYTWLIFPVGYLIKFATQSITHSNLSNTDIIREANIEHGGKLIGQFERIIILTLVLLGQYEAIGFLITGKSIIRFAGDGNLKSEYVLVGTMMSYALAILTGVVVNYLLSFC